MINDLLDLTKTEEGQSLIKDEVFDLGVCINEATDPFLVDAKRKGIEYQVTKHSGLPQFVHGDSRRVRQAVSNITANAVAHTHIGSVSVEAFVSDVRDGTVLVDFVVADSGVGMNPKQLDALFRELEQVSTEELGVPSSSDGQDEQRQARTLGLGLAVVARIVRNMDGQLRLKSEEGHGSRFVIQLPFQLTGDTPSSETGQLPDTSSCANPAVAASVAASAASAASPAPSASASLKIPQDGEITLIERSSHMNLAAEAAAADRKSGGADSAGNRRRSVDSMASLRSQKSDVERLIDAIKTPLSLNDNQTGYFLPGQVSAPNSRQQTPAKVTSDGVSRPTSSASQKAASPWKMHSREEPGTAEVRDCKTKIRAVKVPDDFAPISSKDAKEDTSRISFELPMQGCKSTKSGENPDDPQKEIALTILVAEDDPINMKILRKRLERIGHEVHHAVNGEDCATVYKDESSEFDVVLMDMQVRPCWPLLRPLCCCVLTSMYRCQ